MKFSIAYAAKWGHALHVELTFAAADGYQDTMDLPMTTRDGYHWGWKMAQKAEPPSPFRSCGLLLLRERCWGKGAA